MLQNDCIFNYSFSFFNYTSAFWVLLYSHKGQIRHYFFNLLYSLSDIFPAIGGMFCLLLV